MILVWFLLAISIASAQTTVGGSQLRETPAEATPPADLKIFAITPKGDTPRLEIGSGLSLMASNGLYTMACMAPSPGVTDAAFTRFGQSITVLANGGAISFWRNGLRQKRGVEFNVSNSPNGVAMITPAPGIVWPLDAIFVIDVR